MTLPPERIGDKGQRYVILCRGWPEEHGDTSPGFREFAYCHYDPMAVVSALSRQPAVYEIKIHDRETGKDDIAYQGAIRP